MLSLKGQAAVLVGGAGSIGSATALLLSELGAGIVICDQDEAAAGNLKVKLDAAGRHCDMLVLDGCDDKKVGAAAASIAQKCGRIDILVHLLGGSVARHLLDTDMENVRQDIERNLTSAVLWAKATLPQMMKQRSGVMLFCSSVNTRLGGFGQTSYACAKAGLEALASTLTAQYARNGIRFNCVILGTIPGTSPRWAERFRRNPGLNERLAAMYPVGRLGTPADAAHAIAFLASPGSGWISGVALAVDGGISASGGVMSFDWSS